MSGLQFIGREATVTAYKMRGVNVWGIFQGKELITAGAGADNLDDWLEILEPGSGKTMYKLKVYNCTDDPEQITDRTENNGCFGFLLGDPAIGGTVGGVGAYSARLAALEKRLEERDEPEKQGIGDILLGFIDTPDKLIGVIGALKGLLMPGAAMPVAQVAAIGAVTPGTAEANAQALMQRLSAAIDKLEKRDPKIVEHLEKFANLDDFTFKMVIQRLDAL